MLHVPTILPRAKCSTQIGHIDLVGKSNVSGILVEGEAGAQPVELLLSSSSPRQIYASPQSLYQRLAQCTWIAQVLGRFQSCKCSDNINYNEHLKLFLEKYPFF